mgnify:CR=1 FL=1
MKILVTGASGLVGAAVLRHADARGHTVVGTSRSPISGYFPSAQCSWIPTDLSDPDALSALLEQANPELVINCAAVSEAAIVESQPQKADRVNSRFPAQLASASRGARYRWIHLSTDMVFDGSSPEAYGPDSPPSPYGVYGSQKREGEKKALECAPDSGAVVRITIVNGNSPKRNRSIHEKLIRAVRAGKRPSLYTDEFRQPVSASSVARACLRLGEKMDFQGVYHWAGADILSRYDLGCRILQHFGLPPDRIVPARRPEESPPRPAHLRFDVSRLQKEIGLDPEAFEDQLPGLVDPGND